MTSRPTLVAALALLAAAACSRGDGANAGAAGAAPHAVAVRVAPAVLKDVPVEIHAIGQVVSSESVQVRAQVSGTLVAARFKEGQNVRKGDVLFEIDRRPFEAALAEAKARLAQDEARYDNAREDAARYDELVKKEYVTRQQYEATKANAAALKAAVEADRASVQAAQLNLDYCTIRAPISGRTGRRLVDPGNVVSAASTSPLVTIEQVKPVFVQFSVPQRNLAAVRPAGGPPPPVRISASGREVDGTLAFVDNAVDPTTGTLLLKARAPNEDEALWPGESVEVRLQVGEHKEAVVVPAGAVAAGQQGDYAYVVTPDRKAQLRPVVVEQANDREAVIGKGVAAGEQVVTEGQLKLRPGVPVEVLQDAKPEDGKAPSR